MYMYLCTVVGMVAKPTPKTPRDPEGRKRAIVQAAAELIMELGISNITHRKIAERAGVPLGSTTQYFATLDDLRHAAIAFLSEDDARNIELLRAELVNATNIPRALAHRLAQYLSDPFQVRLETLFYLAHAEHPQLRQINKQWNDQLMDVLTGYMCRQAACAIITYGNGLLVQVSEDGTPIDETELAHVFELLMTLTDHQEN